MKIFQTPVLLLFLSPISHALSCITEDIFTAPLANFDIQSFQEELNDLEVDEDYNMMLCGIELFLDYSEQYLEVTFSRELQDSELSDAQVRFDTIIEVMDDGSTELVNILEYACYDEECDKEFAIKHISWLLNAQYTSLNTKVRPLLLGNTSDTVKCFVNHSTTQLCSSGICIAQYDHEETFYDQACVTDDEALGFGLHFTTIVPGDENKIDRSTNFECGYNECNKKSVLAQIHSVAEENYDLKPMLTALDMLDESEKTTKKASFSLSSATTSTTSMQSNIATTHVIGSASFVFGAFLLLSLF